MQLFTLLLLILYFSKRTCLQGYIRSKYTKLLLDVTIVYLLLLLMLELECKGCFYVFSGLVFPVPVASLPSACSCVWTWTSSYDAPHLCCLQKLLMKQKMSYLFPLPFLCLDVCVVHAIRLAQFSSHLISHPFITIWGGGLIRACVLALFAFNCPGSLPWLRSFEGLQSLGVLCFHLPVYTTLVWGLGQSVVEELWGWHYWERVGSCVLLYVISSLCICSLHSFSAICVFPLLLWNMKWTKN